MKIRRVWAPRPEKVEIKAGTECHAMKPAGDGWWEVTLPEESGLLPYGFLLDGRGPFPDPRAPHLPEGVHGPARWVRHGDFRWTDQGWRPPPLSTASLIYEMHVGTFSPEGTFGGAIGRLDHLAALGVTHLQLLPVNTFPGGRGWGYDGVGLYAPFEPYGGPDGLKRLVDACHGRGIAVVLDVVYNHLGPEGNCLAHFGPYFHDGEPTPWGPALNLDGPESDEVRRYVLDNALMWLDDYHIDGLRIDSVDALRDNSARHILREMREEVDALAARTGLGKVLIAESDLNDPRVVRPIAMGGHGMDAQWSDDFHHSLHVQLTEESQGYYADFQGMGKLAKALRQAFVHDGTHSRARRRRHGDKPVPLDGRSFLGYIQNHDQAGNRPGGERIGHLVSPAGLRIAAALLLTSPFIPMLFQGEEWAASSPFLYFTDHGDDALGRAVGEGRLREFSSLGWEPASLADPQAATTFLRSQLLWKEVTQPPHEDVLRWYSHLIRLRRERFDLRSPRFEGIQIEFSDPQRWIALRRGLHQVLVNFSASPHRIPLFPGCGTSLLAASGIPGSAITETSLHAAPESVAILGPEEPDIPFG